MLNILLASLVKTLKARFWDTKPVERVDAVWEVNFFWLIIWFAVGVFIFLFVRYKL
jgi:hypothetical protein